MLKKIIFVTILVLGISKLYAQFNFPTKKSNCGCPLLTLGVYDTQVNFSADTTIEGDNYAKAQKSGDHLQSLCEKQESDQLQVMRVAKQSAVSDIDFKTHAAITRSGSAGNYAYDVSVTITDAYTQAIVKNKKETTHSLAKANDMIDSCVASFGLILDSTIRKYQKSIRKESNYTKWIGLQWQAKPGSKKLKKNKATQVTITVTDCIGRTPAAQLPIHITQTDPNTGILSATNIITNDSGKVAVVFTAKNEGETLVIPTFSFTSVNGKTIKDPTVCGNQKITVDEDNLYKITMDAENTVAVAGKDIKLHGECVAALKTLPDGTYMLEPTDKTRNMNITIEKGDLVNKDGGSGKIIAPSKYTIPFLFTIGKMDKALSEGHGTLYLNTTSPQTGVVASVYTTTNGSVTTTIDMDKGTMTITPPGKTTRLIPEGKSNMYALDAVTNLNLLSGLAAGNPDIAIQNANQNISNAQDQIAFAKRMQSHMNDPAYFKTAQGISDMKKMQAFQQQIGGNIANTSSTTKNIEAEITKKIKDDPNYVGSDQFQSDIGKSHLSSIADNDIYQKPAMAQVTPGAGTVRIEGSFEPKSMEAFNGTLKGSEGPVQVTINIKVEKME